MTAMVRDPIGHNLVMTPGAQGVGPASTLIIVTPLGAYRYTRQIERTGYPGIGTEICHQGLPLRPMGPHPAQPIDLVNNIVGHLVGHGGHQILGEVFGEQVGIITNTPSATDYPIHAGGTTAKIKLDRDGFKLTLQKFTGAMNILDSGINDLLLLILVDGSYITH